MSLHLDATAEIIQHSVVKFFENCTDPDLPTLIIAYTKKVQLLPMYGDPEKLLKTLKVFTTANPHITVAGIAVEAYMEIHKIKDKKSAIDDFEKRGGIDKEIAKDAIIINLWERNTDDQYFSACVIDKNDYSFKGSWLESCEGFMGSLHGVKVFT